MQITISEIEHGFLAENVPALATTVNRQPFLSAGSARGEFWFPGMKAVYYEPAQRSADVAIRT